MQKDVCRAALARLGFGDKWNLSFAEARAGAWALSYEVSSVPSKRGIRGACAWHPRDGSVVIGAVPKGSPGEASSAHRQQSLRPLPIQDNHGQPS
jgi:hypothetical protein